MSQTMKIALRKAHPIEQTPFTWDRQPDWTLNLPRKEKVSLLAWREHPPTPEHPPAEERLVYMSGRGHWNYYLLRHVNLSDEAGAARTHIFPSNEQGKVLGPPIHITEPHNYGPQAAAQWLESTPQATLRAKFRHWNSHVKTLLRPAMPSMMGNALLRPAMANGGTTPPDQLLRPKARICITGLKKGLKQYGDTHRSATQAPAAETPGGWEGGDGGRVQADAGSGLRKAAAGTAEYWRVERSKPTGKGKEVHTQVIKPLDEAAFHQYVKPRLLPGVGDNLRDYLDLNPDHTHYKVHQASDISEVGRDTITTPNSPGLADTEFVGVGPLDRLRPKDKGAKQIAPSIYNPLQTATQTGDADFDADLFGSGNAPTPAKLRVAFARHFNLTRPQVLLLSDMIHRWANVWATDHNKKPEDWYSHRIGGIASGLTPRQRTMREAGRSYLSGERMEHNGVPLNAWTERDFHEAGVAHGVPTLGGLSPIQTLQDGDGKEWAVPGGLDGELTYLDKMHLKAHGYDPHEIEQSLLVPLYKKIVRSARPINDGNPETQRLETFNRLLFGILSPNTPLTPNEFMWSRMRVRDVSDLQRLAQYANLVPPPGQGSSDDKSFIDTIMRKDFKIGAMNKKEPEKGGLGTVSSVSLSHAAILAKQFLKNPDWFNKRPGENWDDLVERVGSQVHGLGSKTASFGLVWQSPDDSEAMAADRHIADKYIRESPEMEYYREGLLNQWNNEKVDARYNQIMKDHQEEVKKLIEEGAMYPQEAQEYLAQAAITARETAGQNFTTFSEMAANQGGSAFIREKFIKELQAKDVTYRDAKAKHEPTQLFAGETYDDMINRAGFTDQLKQKRIDGAYKFAHLLPYHPEHNPKGTDWIEEPEKVNIFSDMYRNVLNFYRGEAKKVGLGPFAYQWMVWDRRRHRLEPHEVMHPGLYRFPKPNFDQAMLARKLHGDAGYMNSSKDPETMELAPARPLPEGVDPANLSYFQGNAINPTAAAHLLRDGRTVMQAFEKPNFSSAIHELGHVFLDDLRGAEIEVLEKSLKVPGGYWEDKNPPKRKKGQPKAQSEDAIYHPGHWSAGNEERFARLLERYFHDAQAPTARLQKVFNHFGHWMQTMYNTLSEADYQRMAQQRLRDAAGESGKKGKKDAPIPDQSYKQMGINVKIEPEVRAILDRRFSAQPTVPQRGLQFQEDDLLPPPTDFDTNLAPAEGRENRRLQSRKSVIVIYDLKKAVASVGLKQYEAGATAQHGTVGWKGPEDIGANVGPFKDRVKVRKVSPDSYQHDVHGGMVPLSHPQPSRAVQAARAKKPDLSGVIRADIGEPDKPNAAKQARKYRIAVSGVREAKRGVQAPTPGKGLSQEESAAAAERFMKQRAGQQSSGAFEEVPITFESEDHAHATAKKQGWNYQVKPGEGGYRVWVKM